jgi:hypothetical protein
MPSCDDDDLHVPLHELSHGWRTACVLIGVGTTAVGFLLALPYAGYAYSAAGFAPAVIMLVFAARGRGYRWLLLIGLAPVLGLGLAIYSCIWVVVRLGAGLAPTLLIPPLITSLITFAVLNAAERR